MAATQPLPFTEPKSPRHRFGPRPPGLQAKRPAPVPEPTPLLEGDLLSAARVAKLLDVCADTVYRLVAAGHLGEPVYIGRAIKVRRAAVERFVERGGSK